MPALPPSAGEGSTGTHAQRSDAPSGRSPALLADSKQGSAIRIPCADVKTEALEAEGHTALHMAHPTPAHTAEPPEAALSPGSAGGPVAGWPTSQGLGHPAPSASQMSLAQR